MAQKTQKQNLYLSVKEIREQQTQPYYRVLLSGYLNDDQVKKQNINPQKYIANSINNHLRNLTGYLYIKGLFYLHLLEAKDIRHINDYLHEFYKLSLKQPNVHNQIRIVYQSYESSSYFFKKWQCDHIAQAGPALIETDKTEQQIADKSFQIYESLHDGAETKKQTPNYKLANMFHLSNDDMSLLICKNFMSLQQYYSLYLQDYQPIKQCESNYPLPPNIFNTMQFLQIEDYTKYK